MTLSALLQRPRAAGAAVLATARDALPDAMMVAGAAAIAYGGWLIYPAAGFIVGGALSIVGGVLAARRT